MEYSCVRLPEYSEIVAMSYMVALFLAVLYVGLFTMLPRDVILSLRPNSRTLDLPTRRLVTRLGCARQEFCYRGRRAGKHVQARASRLFTNTGFSTVTRHVIQRNRYQLLWVIGRQLHAISCIRHTVDLDLHVHIYQLVSKDSLHSLTV